MDYNFAKAKDFHFFLMTVFLFASIQVAGQSETQRKSISSNYKIAKIETMVSIMERDFQSKERQIELLAKSMGLKKIERKADGTLISLEDIGSDGTPLFYTTLMDPTSKVSRANELYKGGAMDLDLNGAGLQVGVWDGGVALPTHQEFGQRVSNADASQEVSSHATMVTGTLVSSGIKEKAKGVVFAAEALTHDWTRDKIEVAEAATNGMLLSNHSYGIKSDRVPDWYFGSYIKVSQDWDDIMYNAPYYLMVTAAGNAQNSYDNEMPIHGTSRDGFDLLLGFAVSKNGITVAGANTKINKKGELTSATVANYSSFGPVDDGRIKPDLAGDGTGVFSTSASNNQSYSTSTGTSMATPGVTGSLLLLQQYHEQLYGRYMKAATLKGLALHTADDVSAPGPDYKMGWGVLNAKRAAEVLKQKDYSTLVSEEQLTNGQTYSITVEADGTMPLMASISWTDPKGNFVNRGNLNDVTAALTNDLDIRITKNGAPYHPWKLNAARAGDPASKGDNRVDPYERIDIVGASGEYTITVTHKGSLTNGIQDFSLIVSGVKMTTCDIRKPLEFEMVSSTENNATFTWNFDYETLYEVQYREAASDWLTDHTYKNAWSTPNLEIGTTYEVRLRSVCTQNMVSEFSEPVAFVFNGADTQPILNEPLSLPEALAISLYPNPAVDEITVDAEVSKDAVYSIITASGNIIKKGALQEAVNVSDLAAGLYVMMVEDYSGVKSSKFYKN
ncbi:S8 family serine peptidase [Allomuricauda sp. d1]|uniref:S8 family serine peptidase n=1 Tax=Allomuricauda sp. d1 TaxID=3136725 RepID=UPI0031D93F5A